MGRRCWSSRRSACAATKKASGTAYVPDALFEEWAARDPLLRFERVLDARGVMPAEERDALRQTIKEEIDGLVDDAVAGQRSGFHRGG